MTGRTEFEHTTSEKLLSIVKKERPNYPNAHFLTRVLTEVVDPSTLTVRTDSNIFMNWLQTYNLGMIVRATAKPEEAQAWLELSIATLPRSGGLPNYTETQLRIRTDGCFDEGDDRGQGVIIGSNEFADQNAPIWVKGLSTRGWNVVIRTERLTKDGLLLPRTSRWLLGVVEKVDRYANELANSRRSL